MIEKLLKTTNARITLDNRWLVWHLSEYTVFEHTYGKKHSDCIYQGQSLDAAIEALVGQTSEDEE